ncbi:MAG: class I SAM-dependent methyltransferase [Bacteroidales bacterium]|nr:class I SAM-dependent methyltransferase [Bacteroidales bacterium]
MIRLIFKHIVYKIFAKHKKGHGIHSPFVFSFIQNVLQKTSINKSFQKIHKTYNELRKNNEKVEIKDYGAGSKIHKRKVRKIKSIARTSGIDKKYGIILNRMVEFYNPKTVIELGTSLGIGTLYLASANPEVKVITIEGCPAITGIAKKVFESTQYQNINLINNQFNSVLNSVLSSSIQPLFVYIDGNHRHEATLEYFANCMPYFDENSILVIGDIHWSKGMEKAWKKICADERIKISIDLFHLGILFFNKGLSKQHFVIKS